MAYWLFKEEPSHFSFADLERAGRARWEGVKNPLALQHLRAVKPGDWVLLYHTGKEKSIVGEMKAKSVKDGVVTVIPVRRFAKAVPLSLIKEQALCKDWELVRISRLSVMRVPPAIWKWIMATAQDA